MNLTDMLLGHQALERMGYSPELIRRVLSRREFASEAEMYAALDEEKAREEEVDAGTTMTTRKTCDGCKF